jgi:hypothetical protein
MARNEQDRQDPAYSTDQLKEETFSEHRKNAKTK